MPIRKAGYGIDKSMAELGGVPGASRRMRPPYAAVPDDLFAGLVEAARRHLDGMPASFRT